MHGDVFETTVKFKIHNVLFLIYSMLHLKFFQWFEISSQLHWRKCQVSAWKRNDSGWVNEICNEGLIRTFYFIETDSESKCNFFV